MLGYEDLSSFPTDLGLRSVQQCLSCESPLPGAVALRRSTPHDTEVLEAERASSVASLDSWVGP